LGRQGEDFPDLPEEKTDLETLEFNPMEFYNAVSLVSFCASLDDSRPVFTGVYLNFDGETLTLAASDGFRLSETKLKADKKGDEFIAVIPAKTLMDVARVYADGEDPISFSLDKNDNLVMFKQNDTVIATRILDGEYRQYENDIQFEILPEIIGDRGQQIKHPNQFFIDIIDNIINENDYEMMLFTFLLFLSFLQDMQKHIIQHVINPEAFQRWVILLNKESKKILGGTGDATVEFIQNSIMKYIDFSGILITNTNTYRVETAIQRRSK